MQVYFLADISPRKAEGNIGGSMQKVSVGVWVCGCGCVGVGGYGDSVYSVLVIIMSACSSYFRI